MVFDVTEGVVYVEDFIENFYRWSVCGFFGSNYDYCKRSYFSFPSNNILAFMKVMRLDLLEEIKSSLSSK